jgi:hypothetical protein
MKIQYFLWCGEGDLFSCASLKTRKLYTLRRPQSSKKARNTNPSHTASHTDSYGGHNSSLQATETACGIGLSQLVSLGRTVNL